MSLNSDPFTLGIEEEYQIIDPLTGQLCAASQLLLPEAEKVLGDAVQYEIILSQIEVATPVCSTLHEAKESLINLRSGIIAAADKFDKQIAAAGTHPYSHWSEQQITPKERYKHLIDTYGQSIREQVIFGCHVHIGIPDREIATLVQNHARLWLAPLMALSANSPFFEGYDTGYEQFRNSLWWTVPLSGPPPTFSSYGSYQDTIQEFVNTGSIEDATQIYWDMRLSQRFNTLEFRAMDVCMNLEDTIVLAGLIRALVHTCYDLVMQHIYADPISSDFLSLAHWRASRYGLNDDLIDIQAKRRLPASQVIEHMLEFVKPALEATDDWQRVSSGIRKMLTEGNGATKQRAIYRQTGQLSDVVKMVVAETRNF